MYVILQVDASRWLMLINILIVNDWKKLINCCRDHELDVKFSSFT